MPDWDREVDFVVVGSGGGGLVAAITAADAGLETIVVEKMPVVGGSTGMSGGVLWLPDNPLMREAGVADSVEDGLAHFEAVVGDVGPASSDARREAYIVEGNAMVEELRAKGVRFLRADGYADYHSDAKGGHERGRSIEPAPFDAARLGELQDNVIPGLASSIGMVVLTNELRSIQYFNRSLRSLLVAIRVFARTMLAKVRRRTVLSNGAALVGNLLAIAADRGIPVWREAPLSELVVEDGRVVGAVVVHEGAPTRIRARRGVLLAAGGFGHNAEMRGRYGGDQPNDGRYSFANPGDTGEVLEMAVGLGARTAQMDEAWWLPSAVPQLAGSTLGQARHRPRAILVNTEGRRFVSEADSMMVVGKAIYAESGGRCWAITDDVYRRRYANGKERPGVLPEEWVTEGLVKRSDTLEGLAAQIEVDPAVLAETVARYNADAVRGDDPQFGRGRTAYHRCMGDTGKGPNPSVDAVATAPFYATEIIPADVGTSGGVLTDEHGRVIGADEQPIPGLYATGNLTAGVMGRSYLGAGASIASTMVFGYTAAKHAATAAA
ncbi:FAD-binding protein [Nocardioides sp. YIM 152588]|uniref:FAD-binding protein n=1 Tax=Nocardioides sp. YIM 152588 TaxID=3158259 RepID=UPI0032E4A4A5